MFGSSDLLSWRLTDFCSLLLGLMDYRLFILQVIGTEEIVDGCFDADAYVYFNSLLDSYPASPNDYSQK